MQVNDFVYTVIIEDFVKFFLFGGGIFAAILGSLKVLLYVNSMKIFSFMRIYKNRNKLLNHNIFSKIDNVTKNVHISYNVRDLAKKELIKDVVHLELFRMKQILKNNLKMLFKTNLKDYMTSFRELNGEYLTDLFINEYTESKETTKEFARRKFTKNGYMSQEHFNRFWNLYYEISVTYDVYIFESLKMLAKRKNLYSILWAVMDNFDVLIEIIFKTIAHNINIMNGRSYGIKYKGYTIGLNDVGENI